MRFSFLLLPPLLALWAGNADAQMQMRYIGATGCNAQLPGDIATNCTPGPTPILWGGMRAFNSAKAGASQALVNVCSNLDATCEDQLSDASGNLVLGTFGATCNSVTCTVKTVYAQINIGSGATNFTNGTQAQRPQFIIDCTTLHKPCMRFNNQVNGNLSAISQQSNNIAFMSTAFTKRTSLFTSYRVIMSAYNGSNGYQLSHWSAANTLASFVSAFPTWTTGVTDNTWLSIDAIENGASSVHRTNGQNVTVDTGSVGYAIASNMVIGNDALASQSTCVCDITEVGLWIGATTAFQNRLNQNKLDWYGQ